MSPGTRTNLNDLSTLHHRFCNKLRTPHTIQRLQDTPFPFPLACTVFLSPRSNLLNHLGVIIIKYHIGAQRLHKVKIPRRRRRYDGDGRIGEFQEGDGGEAYGGGRAPDENLLRRIRTESARGGVR